MQIMAEEDTTMCDTGPSAKVRASFWESLSDRIRSWSGRTPDAQVTTADELHMIAEDAINESGSGDFLKRYAASRDPKEREALKQKWERTMGARRGDHSSERQP